MDSIDRSSTSRTVRLGDQGAERRRELMASAAERRAGSSAQHHEESRFPVINGSNLSDCIVLPSHLVTLRSLIGPVDEECPICRCTITDRAVTNTCRHGFDRECLESSIRQSGSSCPVCRTSFDEINHRIESEDIYQTIPVASLLSDRRDSGQNEEEAEAELDGQLEEVNGILGSLLSRRGTSIIAQPAMNATPVPQARVGSRATVQRVTASFQSSTATKTVDPVSSPESTSVNVGSQSDTEEDTSTSLPSQVQLAQAEPIVRVSRVTSRDFNSFPAYRTMSRQAEGENRAEQRSRTPLSRIPLSVQVEQRQEQRRSQRRRAPRPRLVRAPPPRLRERIVPTRAATSPRFEAIPRPEQPSTMVQRPRARPSQRVRRLVGQVGRLTTMSRTNVGGRNGVRPAAQRLTARLQARRTTASKPTVPRPTVLRPTASKPTVPRPVTQPESETQSMSPLSDTTSIAQSPESDVSSWSVDGSVSEGERSPSRRRLRSRTSHERRGGYGGRRCRFGPRVSNRRRVRLYLQGRLSRR